MRARPGGARAKRLLVARAVSGHSGRCRRCASARTGTAEVADPCSAVMNAAPGTADPLASAGLEGRSVPAELVRAFVPANLTCVGRVTASESYVRGVFIELADPGGGGTAAVYVALHPKEQGRIALWQRYLEETFPSQLAFDERGDGSMLALMSEHPSSPAALASYREGGQTASLWPAVDQLIAD